MHISLRGGLPSIALLAMPAMLLAQEQSPEQQRCTVRLLGDTVALSRAQSMRNAACVRDAAKGLVSDLGACLAPGDVEGPLATASRRLAADAHAHCAASPPDFGLPLAFDEVLRDAALVHPRGLVADLFGEDAGGAIVSGATDGTGARCQLQTTKRTAGLVLALTGAFTGCVKKALKQGAASADDLTSCVGGSPRGNVAKAAAKLRRAARGGACRDVDVATVFPGRCGDAGGGFADCLVERAACRACRLAATAAALDVDCDLADDGEDDDSCRFPVTLAGDAIPFIGSPDGRIAGATISIVELPGRQVVTSADGAFLFEELEEGSEVTLELSHPEYHAIQTATIRLGSSGAGRVTFQAVTHTVYDLMAQLLEVVPDDANRCQMVTTVTRFGKSLYDPGAHGEDGTTVTLAPPLPAEHGPIYFNASVLPDRTLTETSEDGGVLFIQVPPGEYVWTARKPDRLISRIRMKCRVGYLVNASPPWGLQTHATPE